MGPATKLSDLKTLAQFSPLDQLDHDKLKELADKSKVQQFKAQELILAPAKGTQSQLYFLLSGTLVLDHPHDSPEQIKAGSLRANRAICNQKSSSCRVLAKTAVSILTVDAELLELLLNWGGSQNNYHVDEFIGNGGEDWMSGLLQNKAFLNLSPTQLQSLMNTIEPIEFLAGDTIIKQGELDDYYYIISTGQCAVTLKEESGHKTRQLAELGPGDAFGEEALITQTARSATVTMTTDGLLLRLKQQDFSDLLQESLIKIIDYSQAAQLKQDGAETIDVRPSDEFVQDGLGINMPLATLRLKLTNLDKTKPYITCCSDGRQSAVAAFLLNQHGLDAYVLKGGLNSLVLDNGSSSALFRTDKQQRDQSIDPNTMPKEGRETIMTQKAEPDQTIVELNAGEKPFENHDENNQHNLPDSNQQQAEIYKNEVFRLEDLNTELLHTIQHLEKHVDQVQIQKQRQEFESLAREKQDLTAQLLTLEEHLSRTQQDNQIQHQKITELTHNISSLTSTLERTQTSLDEKSENVAELSAEIAANKNLSNLLKEEHDNYKSDVENQLLDSKNKIDSLTRESEDSANKSAQEKTALLAQIDAHQHNVESLNQENKALHSSETKLAQTIESLNNDLTQQRDNNLVLEQELSNGKAVIEEKNSLARQLAQAEQQEKQLRLTIIKLSKSTDELEEINENHQQSTNILQTKLDQQLQTNSEQLETINQHEIEQRSLHEVIEASSQQLLEEQTAQHNLIHDLEDKQNELNSSKKLNEELQKKVFTLQNQVVHIEEIEQELDNINTALSSKGIQLKQEKNYSQQLADENNELQSKFKEIQKEIDTFSNQRRYLKSLEQSINQKDQQISQLQQKLQKQPAGSGITEKQLNQERQRSQAVIDVQNNLKREIKTLLKNVAAAELRAGQAEDELLILKSEMMLTPPPKRTPTPQKNTHSDDELIRMGRTALEDSNVTMETPTKPARRNTPPNPFEGFIQEKAEKPKYGKIAVALLAIVGIYFGSTSYMDVGENNLNNTAQIDTILSTTPSQPQQPNKQTNNQTAAQQPTNRNTNQTAIIQEETSAHKTREQQLLEQARSEFQQRNQ